MKRLMSGILALVLCLWAFPAFAEEGVALTEAAAEGAQTAETISAPEVRWTFSVSLTTLSSKYVRLVNADSPLDEDFEPDPLVKVTGVKRATSAAVYLEETAAKALIEMFEAAKEVTEYTYTTESGSTQTATFPDGMTLYLKSGYRSYGTQATTYANYLARNNNVDDGYVAKPGASEHQTGICADILNADYAGRPTMTQDFKWTPEAQWMKENCAKFGFILRFPENAEDITGIKFEPWHFRYVGQDAAWYIEYKGITLEEFDTEALFAIAQFEGEGGDIDAWIAYEYSRVNAPPESYLLDVYGEDGDAEVSLVF